MEKGVLCTILINWTVKYLVAFFLPQFYSGTFYIPEEKDAETESM